MRIALYTLTLAGLMILGTTGCDFSEQNVSWEPGDSLIVNGPVDEAGGDISEAELSEEGLPVLLAPVEAYFYITGFTTEREYVWTVNGSDVSGMDNAELLNDGEFLRLDLTEPGTYMISVESAELSGTQEVVVEEGDESV